MLKLWIIWIYCDRTKRWNEQSSVRWQIQIFFDADFRTEIPCQISLPFFMTIFPFARTSKNLGIAKKDFFLVPNFFVKTFVRTSKGSNSFERTERFLRKSQSSTWTVRASACDALVVFHDYQCVLNCSRKVSFGSIQLNCSLPKFLLAYFSPKPYRNEFELNSEWVRRHRLGDRCLIWCISFVCFEKKWICVKVRVQRASIVLFTSATACWTVTRT